MLIDCFTYNNESDLLEGRLEYLNDIVDMFVIVESDILHSGIKKEQLNYFKDFDKFRKYAHKIMYFPIHMNPENYDFVTQFEDQYQSGFWKAENEQRNHIMQGLNFFNDDAFVMISDLDEIPRKKAIFDAMKLIGDSTPMMGFKQDLYFYNLNQKQVYECYGTVLTKLKTVRENSPQWVRLKRWRHYIPYLENAGWHLSYWGSPDEIRRKTINAPHQEYNKPKWVNIDHIKNKIINHQDLFDRDNPLQKVNRNEIDEDFRNIFQKYEIKLMQHFYDTIEGEITEYEKMFFKQILDLLDGGHFVHYGCHKGKHTAFFIVEILASGKEIKYDCIDDFFGLPQYQFGQEEQDIDVVNDRLVEVFLNNMIPAKNHITAIKATTCEEAVESYENESLDFVFIDHYKQYEDVKIFIDCWLPKLKMGGIISGRGYNIEPVKQAVDKKLNFVNSFDSTWWIKKNYTHL